MKTDVEKLRRQLEAAGAMVMIPDDLPEEVLRAFVEELAHCPDCAQAMAQPTDARKGEH